MNGYDQQLSGWESRRRDEDGHVIGHAVDPGYFMRGLKDIVDPSCAPYQKKGTRFMGPSITDTNVNAVVEGSGVCAQVSRLNHSLATKQHRVENRRRSILPCDESEEPCSLDSEEYRGAQDTLGSMAAVLAEIRSEVTAAQMRAKGFGKDLSIWHDAMKVKGGIEGALLVGYAAETLGHHKRVEVRPEKASSDVHVGWQRARAVHALSNLTMKENVHDTPELVKLPSDIERVDVKVEHYRSRAQLREQVITPIEKNFVSSIPDHPTEKIVNVAKVRSDPLMLHPKAPLPFSRPTTAVPGHAHRPVSPGHAGRPVSAVATGRSRPLSAPGVAQARRPVSAARVGQSGRPMSARTGEGKRPMSSRAKHSARPKSAVR